MEGCLCDVGARRSGILNFAAMSRNIVLFIAASADGFIAAPDGNIDFLNLAELPGEDYGYAAFTASVDTVILGRKTYEKVLSMGVTYPHEEKTVYVFSRKPRPANGHIHFVQETPTAFAQKLKAKSGKDIYCDAGAEIIAQLLSAALIDRIILTIIPVNLFEGILLFPNAQVPESFVLHAAQTYPLGIVQRTYVLKNTDSVLL